MNFTFARVFYILGILLSIPFMCLYRHLAFVATISSEVGNLFQKMCL